MLGLAIVAAVLGAIFLVSLLRARRLSFPAAYEVKAAPLEGLPEADAKRIEAWGAALEAAGFSRIGDFRSDLEIGAPGGWIQVEQKRVWLSSDRTTWAAAKRVSLLNPSAAEGTGIARGWLLLGFTSRLPSGGIVSTSNSAPLGRSPVRDPDGSIRVFAGVEDAAALRDAHARHLGERKPEPLEPDLPSFERKIWERLAGLALDQGIFERRGERYQATARFAWTSTARGFNPLAGEEGRPAAIAGRLLGLAVATLGAELVLLEGGAPAWATALPFAAAALAACLAFRHVPLLAWIYAMLPAHLALTSAEAPPGWAWAGGTLTLLLALRPIEARRYRRAARALARDDAAPAPLNRAALATAYALALLGSAGLLVWLRAPNSFRPETMLLVAGAALALAGLLLADVVVSLLPSTRRSPIRAWMRLAGTCALFLLAGLGGGAWLAARDEKASAAAAAEVLGRLERYRQERGDYPDALETLGPLPAPRPGPFFYLRTPEGFRLSWPTARGVSTAGP